MRRLLTLCALVALGIPAAIQAGTEAGGDGTLAIKNATGTIRLKVDGVVIGHADKIVTMTVTDKDKTDGRRIILGAEGRVVLGSTKTQYSGEDIRFKFLGGENIIFIRGSGISLSVVGEGEVSLDGGNVVNDGKYSIDDGPFKGLPDSWQTFSFGG